MALATHTLSELLIKNYRQTCDHAFAQFTRSNRIEPLWRALTQATDALLAQLVTGSNMTLIAVGGYGRGELFPYSDIDVMILLPPEATESDLNQATALVAALWARHALLSHAVRTPDEVIAVMQADHSVAASLLSARYVAGDAAAFAALTKRMTCEIWGQHTLHFVEQKLQERELRHKKWGDSRFLLEPNVKESKGALRDVQTLLWIAGYCYNVSYPTALLTQTEWRRVRYAYLFFATVRAHMHLKRNRAEDRLTFDLQTQIAQQLNFRGRTLQQKAERLMRRYFQYARESGTLTRIFCANLDQEKLRPPSLELFRANEEAMQLPGLLLQEGRLNFIDAQHLTANPSLAVAIFKTASDCNVALHPEAYRVLARTMPAITRQLVFEGKAYRELLQLMLDSKSPEAWLRRMNEAGVLGALIPEFERIAGMMQYDGYHTYTVDEHSLVAIGNLAALEQGQWQEQFPLASRLVHLTYDRAVLYIALLCHDLAKGSGGAHAEKGEALVARIAQRVGFSQSQIEMAAWLVKHQELFTATAFKRDLDDPQTLKSFVALVQSPLRLRLLLLLTVCDIKAVGPAIWNGWKGALLRMLYANALALMESGDTAEVNASSDATGHVHRQWQTDPASTPFVVTHDRFRAISELTCATANRPTALREFAGVLAYLGASIVTARMQQEDSTLLLTFGIQDYAGNSFADEEIRLERLPHLLRQAVAGKIDFAQELAQRRMMTRGRKMTITPNVAIDSAMSDSATVIEVSAQDRIGLLYNLLRAFDHCEVRLVSAQLATYGAKAVDVFYVTDFAGQKVTGASKLAAIERALLVVCTKPDQTTTP